jgi:hypothetical protein
MRTIALLALVAVGCEQAAEQRVADYAATIQVIEAEVDHDRARPEIEDTLQKRQRKNVEAAPVESFVPPEPAESEPGHPFSTAEPCGDGTTIVPPPEVFAPLPASPFLIPAAIEADVETTFNLDAGDFVLFEGVVDEDPASFQSDAFPVPLGLDDPPSGVVRLPYPDVATDLLIGMVRNPILFVRDDSPASDKAAKRAADLTDSNWYILTVPLTHELASRYCVETAPTFVALRDGKEVGRSKDATSYADTFAMLTLGYADAYTDSFTGDDGKWTVAGLKEFLRTYKANSGRRHTGVANRTVFHHLTDPGDPHHYDAALVKALTAAEQQLLHDADHDGLAGPNGPLSHPLTTPVARKAPVKHLPKVAAAAPAAKPKATTGVPRVMAVQPYCPNCVRPQTFWGWR